MDKEPAIDLLKIPNYRIIPECEDVLSDRCESCFLPDPSTCTIASRSSTSSIDKLFRPDTLSGPFRDSIRHACTISECDEAMEDSGLDSPLADSPESWGQRKYDRHRRRPFSHMRPYPMAPNLSDYEALQCRYRASVNECSSGVCQPSDVLWTFDELLTISLLQAQASLHWSGSEQLTKSPASRYFLVTRFPERMLCSLKIVYRKFQW